VTVASASPPSPSVAGPQSAPLTRSVATTNAWQCTAAVECTATIGVTKMGHRYIVSGWYCPSTRPSPLLFPTATEADFQVRQGARLLWSSAADHPVTTGRHALTVDPTKCVHWETRWTARTNAGVRLPAGTYTLTLITMAQGAQPTVHPTTFRLP